MASMTLDALKQQLLSLTEAEKEMLLQLLETQQETSVPSVTEEEIQRKLLEKGVLQSLPTGQSQEEFSAYNPIHITGEPLSETIIEERRRVAVLFFDTSGIVKRYAVETGTNWVNSLVFPASPFRKHSLHLASILELRDQRATIGGVAPILISSDKELNVAAAAEGLVVEDPNLHP